MDSNLNAVMERFAKCRKSACTQEYLAEIIGVNPKTISAFETGRRTPSLNTFIKMCRTINADVNYIFFGEENYD